MTENIKLTEDHEQENEPQVVRVIFQFKDGTVQYAEGEDAQEYMETINGALFMDHIHGGDEPQFKFKSAKASDLPQIIAEQIDPTKDNA